MSEKHALKPGARLWLLVILSRRYFVLDRVLLQMLFREFRADEDVIEHWAKKARLMEKIVIPIHEHIGQKIRSASSSSDKLPQGLSIAFHARRNDDLGKALKFALDIVKDGKRLVAEGIYSPVELHNHVFIPAVIRFVRRLEDWIDLLLQEVIDEGTTTLGTFQKSLTEDTLFQDLYDAPEKAEVEVDKISKATIPSDELRNTENPVKRCLGSRWDLYVNTSLFVVSPKKFGASLGSLVDSHADLRDAARERAKQAEEGKGRLLELCRDAQEWRCELLERMQRWMSQSPQDDESLMCFLSKRFDRIADEAGITL